MKRFRGGLVCKAHRPVYHSTLGLRVIKKKKKEGGSTLFETRRFTARCKISEDLQLGVRFLHLHIIISDSYTFSIRRCKNLEKLQQKIYKTKSRKFTVQKSRKLIRSQSVSAALCIPVPSSGSAGKSGKLGGGVTVFETIST